MGCKRRIVAEVRRTETTELRCLATVVAAVVLEMSRRPTASSSFSRKSLTLSAFLVLAICLSGCSRSGATSSKARAPSVTQSGFLGTGDPSRCPAKCVRTALAIAREQLGLAPEGQTRQRVSTTDAIFTSLEEQGASLGSTITRVPIADVIEKMVEGPAVPVVLVHKTGHLYALFGAIRVNNKLLCQVVHGGEAVSLLPRETLFEGDFQEAWRFERKQGAGVPVHFGSAVVEIDKLWHNFGEILPDEPVECAFRLKNVGDTTVILGKPVVSCQCTVPNVGAETTLAPGETFDLKVAKKPTGSASLRNSIGLMLCEQGDGVSRPVSLTLIGSQRESMEVNPGTLDFGTVLPGKVCSRTMSLREKPTDRFIIKQVDPGSLPIAHEVEVSRDQYGLATYRVQLRLKANENSPGESLGELNLTTDSYVRPKVTIPVRFRIESPVVAIPGVISLGTVPVGESREAKVQFVARGGESLGVQIESHPEECLIRVDDTQTPPEMVVAVTLKEPGIWQGVISCKVQSSTQEHAIEVRCAGYGQ